ncbi:hypothetical protein [Stenotrophomonas maltophilia]|uniref:hypothetical protein n=1 Tax=Stenotrophomonas maltophilia TaxID=40324 RepID=UPI0011B1D0A2|nr:hypothetical protein [Stenotrophomonas maltophilia]
MQRISRVVAGLLVAMAAGAATGPAHAQKVCNVIGKVAGLIPSQGVAGFGMTVPLTGCSCDHSMIWIDTATDGGKAMYAAVLAAKLNGSLVLATFQDGQGASSPGNSSIAFRYSATCKLAAFEML